ncbi:MurR/RpiR family transcriptional regulator [Bosea sp. PAMC 26642]|uniref:MurR/RpiR family transcriptional regulator n=1 Tax=Bosea sp. (strain PAMC 26642) TaxID=1792307 RepID=UPI0009E6A030|nr:MurR/RpiR family transcriptional regulator [Bosea sp. PAMC 26642]
MTSPNSNSTSIQPSPGENAAEKRKGTGAPGLGSALDRLQALRGNLPPTAARIADFMIGHAADVVHMSVTEVAERAGASEGSVISLCQQLGAKGFQQVKIALARDLVQPVQFIHEDLARTDDTGTVIEKIFRSDLQALHDTMKVLDTGAMEAAVAAILKARRVELYGIGSAAPIAEDAHYRLLRIGVEAKVVVDSHIQAISASLTGPDVTVITISHSGSTHETVSATKLAKEAGATTICITNFGKSPLLAFADIVLHTMARETHFRTEAMTSRIAQLAIIDALIACLSLADYDKALATIGKTFDVLSAKRF